MSGSHNPFVSNCKRLETSNFARTCNLLSQYVRERGSLRDLHLAGINGGKSEAIAEPQDSRATALTLNLLNNIEDSCQPSSEKGKSVDPFSQSAPLVISSCTSDDSTRKASPSKEGSAGEVKRPQMTIFYAGEVIVFDDLPAEKAKEIMLLAGKGGSGNGIGCGSWKTTSSDVENICSGDAAVASSSKALANSVSAAAKESPKQPQLEANTSELPIARRSSLHRFLAKRKDRAGARAPYQLHDNNHNNNNNDGAESSSKNDQEQLQLKL